MSLQIKADFIIANRSRTITNRGKSIANGGSFYKLEQLLQIGANKQLLVVEEIAVIVVVVVVLVVVAAVVVVVVVVMVTVIMAEIQASQYQKYHPHKYRSEIAQAIY